MCYSDDIEVYLTTFERRMMAYEIPRGRWSCKLAPQLSGRAQQAYTAMNAEESTDYDKLKEALSRRYDINQESYRLRLHDLVDKWLKECSTIAVIKDQIVLEQLIETLSKDVGYLSGNDNQSRLRKQRGLQMTIVWPGNRPPKTNVHKSK